MVDNYEYQVGASLPPDAPSYVVRKADSDFYHALKAGKYCYVFNSRQMGKSSLKVRVMQRLVNEGVACSSIDVSGQGSKDNVTQEQWYTGIVSKIVKDLQIAKPIEFRRTWWRDRHDISPVQRLDEFIEDVLLSSISGQIIIFVDEIDSTLSLKFASEDFFALIRSCYNKRAENPAYKRLTFALLGVATPGDLIQDKTRTPFNIGEAIELDGFKIHEIEPLAKGLAGKVANPQAVMQEVLAWTGGQPFLTQRVCELLGKALSIERRDFKSVDENQIIELVKEVINNQIIDNWEANDKQEHLKTIRDRLLINEEVSVALLGLYQQILQQKEMTADSGFEQMRLRLTGLVVQQQGKLRVYNQIYGSVFDINWVENELGKLRFYADKLRVWVESNYQDNSCLLWGEDLEKARVWANIRKLSDVDYRFLSTSLEAELNQKVVKAETRLNQAFQEEEKARQRLTEVEKKTNQRIRIGLIVLVISIIGAVGTLMKFNDERVTANQNLKIAKDNLNNLNRQLNQQKQSVNSVALSPDRKTLASASLDNKIKLWNVTTGKAITTLTGHQSGVSSVAFSPDGKTLASASWDKTITLWNVTTGKEITTLTGYQSGVSSVAFSPDGKTLASASWDKTITLWNVITGKEITTITGHGDGVSSVAFSLDGRTATVKITDSTIKFWSLDLDDLLAQGCNYLQDYLATRDELRRKICPNK
ncbi:AAA-like domain-containing protein [Nostoc sp. FACHB-110]|uniref:AAA-like domain-containing protein n=1 Tax=Nostoc sp. FACHB-110 TaxID=2692834 RepID=UPI0016820288|nr:AAA-like domain-containing protein [Nostoc sp. FACHB-110]MBD2435424.1 AAA-like domain-containing protein [Nostoc sp. FACHB-110]